MCVVSLDPHQSLLRCPSSAWSLLILQLLAGEGRGWSRWLDQSLVTPQPSASEPIDPELHVLPLALLQSSGFSPQGSLAGSLALNSTPFLPDSSLREILASLGACWTRVPSPLLVKEPPVGGCPQRPKQEFSVSPHTTQSLLFLSQPSPQRGEVGAHVSNLPHYQTVSLLCSFFFLPHP